MGTVRRIVTVVVAVVLAGWIPLLILGILSLSEGLQQQFDGTRGGNSFPYEHFGRSCIKLAAAYGTISVMIIAYRVMLPIASTSKS